MIHRVKGFSIVTEAVVDVFLSRVTRSLQDSPMHRTPGQEKPSEDSLPGQQDAWGVRWLPPRLTSEKRREDHYLCTGPHLQRA